MSTPDFPVHDNLDVLDGATVYKNDEWWKGIVVYERYGRKIGIYLWRWREDDDRWVRKQKYVVREVEDWEVDRELVDAYLPLLDGEGETEPSEDVDAGDGPDVEAILEDLEE